MVGMVRMVHMNTSDSEHLFLTTLVAFNIYLHGTLHGTFTDLHGLGLFGRNILPQLTQDCLFIYPRNPQASHSGTKKAAQATPHQLQPRVRVNAARNASRSFTGLG